MSPNVPELPPLPPYAAAAPIVASLADAIRPPRRVRVSEEMTRIRVLNNRGGGHVGPWSNAMTPYLVEPMDAIQERRCEGLVFVGPAQCGKTDGLVLNPLAFWVAHDPGDALVIHTDQVMARDFSRQRIAKLNRDSERVGEKLLPSAQADNVFDKQYRGMSILIGWPSIGQLSSRPVPRQIATDYDRMPLDVDGEGSVFDLLIVRGRTFGSRAITIVESSIGQVPAVAHFKPKTPHEAPPAPGILALFNRGDRRLYLCPCPHCGEFFEPAFRHLHWPEDASSHEAAAEAVEMVCPENGCRIAPKHKRDMLNQGRWIAEGQEIHADGTIHGAARQSNIRSYWLKGPAAAFSTWSQLVLKELNALAELEATGDEGALKTTRNTDQADVYIPVAMQTEGSVEAEDLVERAEDYPRGVVPAGARFLTAAVDVQGGYFDVMVVAWGRELESWIVDRFKLFQAEGVERPLDPARYVEDWRLLTERVLRKRYPLAPEGDQAPVAELAIARVAIDSGGKSGVTAKAYAYYRSLRRNQVLRRRILLTKGTGREDAPRLVITHPDSKRKDRRASARGEVPVGVFNANRAKDEVDATLNRLQPGPGFLHLPGWAKSDKPPHDFFEELTAEKVDRHGRWKKVKDRNEALDLRCMAHVAALHLRVETIDWDRPPGWAIEGAKNALASPIKRAAEIERPGAAEAGARGDGSATAAPPAKAHAPEGKSESRSPRRRRRNWLRDYGEFT